MAARQRVDFPLPLVFQRQHSPEDSALWHPSGYLGAIDRHQHAADKAPLPCSLRPSLELVAWPERRIAALSQADCPDPRRSKRTLGEHFRDTRPAYHAPGPGWDYP